MNFNNPFLFDEEEISIWAHRYCRMYNIDKEIKSLITDSRWAYLYCSDVEDDPEVRKNITYYVDAVEYFYNVSKEDKRINRIVRRHYEQ